MSVFVERRRKAEEMPIATSCKNVRLLGRCSIHRKLNASAGITTTLPQFAQSLPGNRLAEEKATKLPTLRQVAIKRRTESLSGERRCNISRGTIKPDYRGVRVT